jgi:hypothetical protein
MAVRVIVRGAAGAAAGTAGGARLVSLIKPQKELAVFFELPNPENA